MSEKAHLEALFDADRRARAAEASLMRESDPEGLSALFAEAVDEALASDDRDDAAGRLERLADLCAQVEGPAMADALIRILNFDEPRVRVIAGEAIRDVGYDRYAEIARAVERALEGPLRGPAMAELPFVLAEIGEPSALKLIKRFLEHPDAETVAAAIESLFNLGDPDAIGALEALTGDDRTVQLDGLDDGSPVRLGDLAEEAIVELGGGPE